MFKTFKRFFTGKTNEVEKTLQKSPSYWEGILKENEGKVKKCVDAHRTALAKLKTAMDRRDRLNKALEDWDRGIRKSHEEFEKTGLAQYQVLSKEAFLKYKEVKSDIEIIEEEISVLSKAEEELRKVKENASSIVNNAKIQIKRNQARAEFNNVVKELTEGIEDVVDIKFEGEEVVNEEYYTQLSKFDDVSLKTTLNKVNDDEDYEKFLKGE